MTGRIAIALCCAALSACSPAPDGLVITHTYGFAPVGTSGMAVAYLTVHNNTGQDIRIESVHSKLFANAEIHETVMQDGHARMRAMENIEIRAGETLELEPGGVHLMLMQPHEPVTAGTVDTLTFNLSQHDAVIAPVEFFARNAPPPMHEDIH
ncbi:copper chaperone PCu(A)C [Woeseia oceani]|nr:copper chaperone PCu(A)C [Woeseia oceani]